LRFCIRPMDGTFVPLGHNGYPHASVLFLGKALLGQLGLQITGCDGETVFSSIQLADLGNLVERYGSLKNSCPTPNDTISLDARELSFPFRSPMEYTLIAAFLCAVVAGSFDSKKRRDHHDRIFVIDGSG
jgi:hypothetical protein